MKVEKAKREILKWDFEGLGLFEATIWDGKITDIRFHRQGSGEGQKLWASDGCEKFLKAVHEALSEVIKHVGI